MNIAFVRGVRQGMEITPMDKHQTVVRNTSALSIYRLHVVNNHIANARVSLVLCFLFFFSLPWVSKGWKCGSIVRDFSMLMRT